MLNGYIKRDFSSFIDDTACKRSLELRESGVGALRIRQKIESILKSLSCNEKIKAQINELETLLIQYEGITWSCQY